MLLPVEMYTVMCILLLCTIHNCDYILCMFIIINKYVTTCRNLYSYVYIIIMYYT